MVAQTQTGTMTANEFWEMYAGKPFELIDGVPTPSGESDTMSPTGFIHVVVAARCIHLLQTFIDDHPIGYVTASEGGFLLSRNPDVIRASDAAFVLSERIPKDADLTKYCPVAPDLAVEVVSPSDRASGIMKKVDLYRTSGTRLVWIVYPDQREVQIHRADRSGQLLTGDDQLDGEDVLPGLKIPLPELWPIERPVQLSTGV